MYAQSALTGLVSCRDPKITNLDREICPWNPDHRQLTAPCRTFNAA
jgi:hypothetical protein